MSYIKEFDCLVGHLRNYLISIEDGSALLCWEDFTDQQDTNDRRLYRLYTMFGQAEDLAKLKRWFLTKGNTEPASCEQCPFSNCQYKPRKRCPAFT